MADVGRLVENTQQNQLLFGAVCGVGGAAIEDISTSYVERQNLSLRMASRRFTRLTNGFSKRLDQYVAAVALLTGLSPRPAAFSHVCARLIRSVSRLGLCSS
jgi:hypothetical protein